MTISPHPLPSLEAAGHEWPDELVDLTDRRRVLVRVVLGVDVPAGTADAIFAGGCTSSTAER